MSQRARALVASIGALAVMATTLAACGSSHSSKASSSQPQASAADGVTPTTITVGNVSSITGPVPGIFQGAQYGTEAYFAYINSLGGVNGRKLEVKNADDAFNCNQNAVQTKNLLPSVLAFVGSFSTSTSCTVSTFASSPDVADVSYVLDPQTEALKNNFSVVPQPIGWRTGPYLYYKTAYPGHTKVGALYAASSPTSWEGMAAALKHVGYNIVYQRGYGNTETDFTADVLRMRQEGVNFVALSSADPPNIARIINEIHQQNWNPLIETGGSIYAVGYLKTVNPGALANTVQDQFFSMFLGEDAKAIPEVALFDTWMAKTHPGFPIDLFSMYSWAEGMLFVQALRSAGANPTRAGLIKALSGIHTFDANGLIAPVDPAGKVPPHCWIAIVVRDNKYVRLHPSSGFDCSGEFYLAKT